MISLKVHYYQYNFENKLIFMFTTYQVICNHTDITFNKGDHMNQPTTSKKMLWTGRVLSGLAIAFLIFDGTIKFFMDKLPPEALEAGAALQWPMEKMPLVGTILLICHSSNIITGRHSFNWVPWRRHCQPCTR
jgi:hypothetical protein